MYAKCGAFHLAEQVLRQLPAPDVVSWNALIGGFTQKLQGMEAIACFDFMKGERVTPNDITYACVLKACGISKNLKQGKQIHEEIICQNLLQNNALLGTALIDMYAKCDAISIAQQILDQLPPQNAASWSALIIGYIQGGRSDEALKCYEHMRCQGLAPDEVTYTCVLKACGMAGAFQKGIQIHNEIAAQGLLKDNIILGNALVDMYFKCGLLSRAQRVFDDLPIHNVISWNTLFMGYVQNGLAYKALDCYALMQFESIFPDTVTYISILKACSIVSVIDMGIQIHQMVLRNGSLGTSAILATALIDMYAKCRALSKAAQMLDELHDRDVVSWNALISGYVQLGEGDKALGLYRQMKIDGICLDAVTYAFALKACGIMQNWQMGEQIYEEFVIEGHLKEDVMVGNSLLDMYAKCGMLSKAQQLFYELPSRDLVSWNVLIAGYVQNGQGEEAIYCYNQMRSMGFLPDMVTYACILKACGIAKEFAIGEKFHHEIAIQGLLKDTDVLGNALVDMYAKCGVLTKAEQAHEELLGQSVVSWSSIISGYGQYGQYKEALNSFQRMQNEGHTPNVVCWNALIGGYAKHGQVMQALGCFQQMQQENIYPDAVTMICILNACSHSGLANEGETYFENMCRNYGLAPSLEHYTCLVDLFCRAGCLDKASFLIKKLPQYDYPPLWTILLGACQTLGNFDLGKLVFSCALHSNFDDLIRPNFEGNF
ncbi:hypothetical protein KP509_02G071400 [Ceratopteris richardii]|nr:hypothetical protein KP509_02G071400 [Ceratopteris richardii]